MEARSGPQPRKAGPDSGRPDRREREKNERAGVPIELQATLTRLGTASPYVSRGRRLAAALAAFDLTVHERVAMDVGASTGGLPIVSYRQGPYASTPWMWGMASCTGA